MNRANRVLTATAKRRAVPPTADARRSKSRSLARLRLAAAAGAYALLWGLAMFRWSGQIMGGLAGALDGIYVDMGSSGTIVQRRRLPARFPRYGSPEFASACRWAVDEDAQDVGAASLLPANATSSVTSYPTSLVPWIINNEGFSSWVSAVAQSYIYSRYLARKHQRSPPPLLLEYEGTNISEVVQPPDERRDDPGWAATSRKKSTMAQWCRKDPKCTTINDVQPVGVVPRYRGAYAPKRKGRVYNDTYDELRQTMPDFVPETGMACALNAMWDPSPKLADHEPALFTELLPELRDDNALVLSLYMRTGWTDVREDRKDKRKEQANVWDESADRRAWQEKAEKFVKPFADCAQRLEREFYANYSSSEEGAAFSKIVWTVLSDAPSLKEYVRDAFQAADSGMTNDTSAPSVSRRVVFTGAEGMHTRSRADPSHAAVAQAFVDWYLLGESDAVVVDSALFSFGWTAALRTARPVYWGETCGRMALRFASSQ